MSKESFIGGDYIETTGGSSKTFAKGTILLTGSQVINDGKTNGVLLGTNKVAPKDIDFGFVKTFTFEYRLKSIFHDRKNNTYTIKEILTVISTKTSSNTTTITRKIANFSTVINSKADVVSKSNYINEVIKDKGKTKSDSENNTKANGLIGPVGNSFFGNVDGMKEVKCPIKNDKEVFDELTHDMPGTPDGSSSGWGSIISYVIDEIQGKSESYVSTATAAAQNNGLPQFYFKNNNDNIYRYTLETLIKILKNE